MSANNNNWVQQALILIEKAKENPQNRYLIDELIETIFRGIKGEYEKTEPKIKPSYEITEDRETITVSLSYPGINQEDLLVKLQGETLTIGSRHAESESNLKITLPVDIAANSGYASLNNGLLKVVFAKKSNDDQIEVSFK